MFSLPDIRGMNERAAKNGKAVRQAAKTGKLDGKPLSCEFFMAPRNCDGKVTGEPYYDIFSDDPKGLISLCKHHREDYSDTPEGYFRCEECNRLMVENYTWELYKIVKDGVTLCLNCARKAWLEKPGNWIDLNGKLPQFPLDVIRKAPHLIAVGQKCPPELTFIGNAEFDSTDGHQISGEDIRAMLTEAKGNGHERAILILDSAYQFAVSIGVYVDADKPKETKKGKR